MSTGTSTKTVSFVMHIFYIQHLGLSIVRELFILGDVPMTVQWLFECLIDKKGGWNDTGCETVKSNATHTSCSCDHLTHFGVLLVSSD